MLAAVPPLGGVTVEARKTLVSLVTPRRTFAIVQASTKNRVDLGLRLTEPGAPAAGGRLQPAQAMRTGSRLIARIRISGAVEGPNPVWSVDHS